MIISLSIELLEAIRAQPAELVDDAGSLEPKFFELTREEEQPA